jgi:hypothetical protein
MVRGKEVELPELRAQALAARAGYRDLLWLTALAAWCRPVGFAARRALVGRLTRRRG